MSKRRPTAREFLDCPYDSEVEGRFFSALSLPNGTLKTTHEHRLDDVNHAAWPYVQEFPSRPVRILDVAASSGISTLEWYEMLCSHGLECCILATDLMVKASLLTFGPIAAMVDAKGTFLHLDVAGIGMYTKSNGAKATMVSWRTAFFARLLNVAGSHVTRQSIDLVSRRFTANGEIQMREDDLFAPNRPALIHAFDVVRAANILNLCYFEKSQITAVLSNLKERLVDGGLLIVCRSEPDGCNHGTIFRLETSRLRPMKQIGRGSEIEELAL